MKKLVITKINDKTIRIEDFVNKTNNVYPAEFNVKGNELQGIVKIYDTTECTVYLAHYTEIEVNGLSFATVQDAVSGLNKFVGNFQSGGSAPDESDDTYVRPSDRPAPPTFAAEEQAIYWLFGVQEHGLNDYCFRLIESSGNYRVDWGDGTVETVASNALAEHKFNFSTLSGQVGPEGYKWVWIKATTTAGNITSINFTQDKPSWRPALNNEIRFSTQVFEMYLQAKYMVTMAFNRDWWKHHFMCEIFEYYGENNMTAGCPHFLAGFRSLRRLKIDTGRWTNFSGFLIDCINFNQSLNDFNTSNGLNFSGFLYAAYRYNRPIHFDTANGMYFQEFLRGAISFNSNLNIDTGNALDLSRFLYGCSSYNKPLFLNSSKCTVFQDFLREAISFDSSPDIDTGNALDLTRFLCNCSSYNKPLILNTSKCANFTGFLLRCYSFNNELKIDTGNATDISTFMIHCNSFNQDLVLDTSKVANFTESLRFLYSMNRKVVLDMSSATSANYLLDNNWAITSVRIKNLPLAITQLWFYGSSMDADALLDLLPDLPDRTGITAGTLILSGTPAALQLTPVQIAMFTAKNWNITLT